MKFEEFLADGDSFTRTSNNKHGIIIRFYIESNLFIALRLI